MHKQSLPDGILAGHSDGQKANSYTSDTEDMTGAHHPPGIIAPIAKRKIDFDLSQGSKVMSEDSAGNISSTQIDTKISTLRDSMLCTAVLSEEYPAATTKSGNNFEKDGNNSSRKPRTVSKAAHGRLKNSQAVTKENLCASSKRKLEAYRARDLEPQEGALANKNNEMFETILQYYRANYQKSL